MPLSRPAFAEQWRKYRQDAVLLAMLATLSIFVRFIALDPIENGGDPLDNWFFVRQWRYETDLATTRIDHHGARMGIHWLTFVVQRLFGPEPVYYFIPTFVIANLCATLTYTLGRQAGGKAVGVIAALLVISSGALAEAANQLRRGIFECFYVLCALNCLLRYLDTTGWARRRWLVASAVAMFLGYLTELPTLYVVPGILYVMYRSSGKLHDPLAYSLILLLLFLAETAIYAAFTQYWHRLDVLFSAHVGRQVNARETSYLFDRFTEADLSYQVVLYPFLLVGPALLVFGRTLKRQAVILPTLCFLFLITFLVRSVDPLVTFTSNRARYMVLAIPPAFVTLAVAAVGFSRIVAKKLAARVPTAGRSLADHWKVAAGFAAALAACASVGFLAHHRYAGRPAPFQQIRADYSLLNDTYARGLPIIARVTSIRRGTARARSLHWVYKGFLSDQLLLKDGGLPGFAYSTVPKRLSNREHYLARRELTAERVTELRKTGCVLEVAERGGTVNVRPQVSKLPERCVP